MDLFNTRAPREQREVIQKHVAALRRKRYLQNVPFIFVPENQLGYFHRHLEELVLDIPNCHILFQGGGNKPGVMKDKTRTADYVVRTRAALDEGLIMFESNWITVTGHIKDRGRDGILLEYKQQLMRYGYDEKMRLTGKYGAHQDDGAIAFMMFIYWSGAVERPHDGNPYKQQFPFLFR